MCGKSIECGALSAVQVVSAALSEQKVPGSTPRQSATFHSSGPCKRQFLPVWPLALNTVPPLPVPFSLRVGLMEI